MTDDSTEPEAEESTPAPWDPATDPDEYTVEDVSSKDWYLDTVLTFVHGLDDEHPGGIVGLTLTSNGVVVSGLAISRAEWVAGVVGQYKQAGADETAKYVGQLFEQTHNDVVEKAKERRGADLPSRSRRFIHMKDVHLGTGNVWTEVPLWRGVLADVTGWSMGSWNPKQTPPSE